MKESISEEQRGWQCPFVNIKGEGMLKGECLTHRNFREIPLLGKENVTFTSVHIEGALNYEHTLCIPHAFLNFRYGKAIVTL